MSGFTELWAKESWNKFDKKDVKAFSGKVVLTSGNSSSQRDNPYKLQTKDALIDLYSGETDDLKAWVGKNVIIEGKEEKFELEGNNLHEIHGCRIKEDSK